APVVCEQLVRSGAFRAKIPLADRTLRFAFDRNQFAILVKNKLPATDSAVRANRSCHLGAVDPRVHRARFVRHRLKTSAGGALTNLTNERPFAEQASERHHIVSTA